MIEEKTELKENPEPSKSGFRLNVKNIVRILALVGMVFFFVPTFLVSCSGQTMKLSVMDCMMGLEVQGEKLTDAHPVCILYLLIPIAIFAIWQLKKQLNEKQMVLIATICSVVDLVMWFILSSQVKAAAEENYCSAKPTIAYWINVILWIVMLILDLAMVFGYLSPDGGADDIKDTAGKLAGTAAKKAQEASGKIQENVKQQMEQRTANNARICPKCGSRIPDENKFCTNCGTLVDDEEKELQGYEQNPESVEDYAQGSENEKTND